MPFPATSRGAPLLPISTLLFIVVGLTLRLTVTGEAAEVVWSVGLVITGLPVVWRTLRGVLTGRFAADLVAMLAIVAALLLAEPLAGLIVVLMQTGGEALERHAERRASRAVRELEAAAPRLAHRVRDEVIEDVAAETVIVDDHLLVRPGELVPCDGVVIEGRSSVDVSRLTGEPVPIQAKPGVRLLSGSLDLDGPLTIRTTAVARESQYARIVELVRTAQASKAPLQRLADRYAVWFTPITLLVCGIAYLQSGDPVRALAVLVVATPCPLILATPVAVIGGINRAARRGIIFRHGEGLEQLATVTVAILDKTGTLTVGRPRVARVLAAAPFTENEILRLAGGVEHGSGHLLARTLLEAVASRGVSPARAEEIIESPGEGVTGQISGRRVAIGGWSYLMRQHPGAGPEFQSLLGTAPAKTLRAYVAVDGGAAGVVEYADEMRRGITEFVASLRAMGVRRVLLLSGDEQANAKAIGEAAGVDEAHGQLLPEEKVGFVRRLVAQGERVLMLGDGTNDAPALSSATVGIALASGGGGIAAAAADAVILTDDPTRVAEGMAISRRTLRVARQSIWAGLGLSGAAMVAAGLGHIPPVIGALLQEAIDVAVIVNALRAALPPAAGRG